MNASIVFVLALAWPQVQTPPPDPQSLADAARKAREAQANQPKATRTFDNDDVKPAAPGTPERPAEAKTSKQRTDPNLAALEKKYRARARQLLVSLKAAEDQSRRLMGDATPNNTIRRSRNQQNQIDANNKKIASLKKQLEDLSDELRHKGLPARWADG